MGLDDNNSREKKIAILHSVMTGGSAFVILTATGKFLCALAFPVWMFCMPITEQVTFLLNTAGFMVSGAVSFSIAGIVFFLSVKGKEN